MGVRQVSTFQDRRQGHCGRVCQSIVLVEEHSSCQLFIPNLLAFLSSLSQKISIEGPGNSVTLF